MKKAKKNKNKFLLVFIVLQILIISGGFLIVNNKSLAEEDYAYKDITGRHSPYLIDKDKEKYIVDMPLVQDRYEEQKYVEMNEPYEDGEGYWDKNPKVDPEDMDSGMLSLVDRKETLLYQIGDDALSYIEVTDDDSWDGKEEEKNIDEWIMSMSEDTYLGLKENAHKLIESNFNWDYRNQNNRDDFLSFRVQEKIYKDRLLSVDIMYDRIMEDLKKNKIIMNVQYDPEDVSVYVNPKIGGWSVESPIILTVNEGGNITKLKMTYMAVLGLGTPKERDVWKLWTTAEKGVHMIMTDYVKNIEEVKNE